MRDAANITAISTLRPDYLGFIYYDKSPRFAGLLSGAAVLPGEIEKVAVFVNATTDAILQVCERGKFEIVQLHGDESPAQTRDLRSRGLRLIKAFSVDDTFDFERTKAYQEHADYFLFDTKGKHYGGNARTFDWRVLENYDQQVPFFLSGGLTPDNITGITRLTDMNLHAVDVNSGVELSPGLKDTGKVKSVLDFLDRGLKK
jgi:phosphoribosylanthranilate isomerase